MFFFFQEPKFETITRETIETFHGNRTERKVTSLEKREGQQSAHLGSHETLSQTSTPRKISATSRPVSNN